MFNSGTGFVEYVAVAATEDSPIDFGSDGNDAGSCLRPAEHVPLARLPHTQPPEFQKFRVRSLRWGVGEWGGAECGLSPAAGCRSTARRAPRSCLA